MIHHLYSKIAITLYLLVALGLLFWAYMIFKDRDGKVVIKNPQQSQQSTPTTDTTDASSSGTGSDSNIAAPADNSTDTDSPILDANTPSAPVEKNKSPISTTPSVSGSMLARITPEHCNNDCQAFKIDLSLFEYCEQACGISPIKDVTNCDNKKDIQKDYCNKDLAIMKKDASICDKINDANIKQTCQNIIEQKTIEDLQRANPRSEPAF